MQGKKDENKKTCSCKSDGCERRGVCCECVAFHRAKNQLPGCLKQLAAK